MKDKQLRKAVKQLCEKLGISYDDKWDGQIEIDEWCAIHGADLRKQPITQKDFYLLLDYLGLEICEATSLRNIKKIKK